MLKRIFSAFLIICLILIQSFTVSAYEPSGVEITANSALLVSLDTDEVLFEKNADTKVYPAALTNIMTSLLILESEKYDPDAKIVMTEKVLKDISGTGIRVSLLKAGEEFTHLDLVYMVLLASCGDCSLLAAEIFGGSVENFVNMMNAKAAELGLKGTNYTNPIGLHDDNHYTTARDTYVLTKLALENETFRTVCETDRYTVVTNMSDGHTFSTTNYLQDTTTNYFYSYAYGVKTGYTDEAGRCVVSTGRYSGENYMCLLFGCPGNADKRYEFIESANLYRWAFNNFESREVADTENPVAEIGVDLSLDTDFVSLYVEDSFVSILPKAADDSTISIVAHPISDVVDAPIKKGQVLGTADVIYAEKVIGTVNLVSNENIERSAMLTVIRGFKNFFTSSYMKVVYVLIGIIVIIFAIAVIRMNNKNSKKRKIKYIPYDQDKKR